MSNFSPLVSIVIPVYNGENYMKEAIYSALGQTYKNIEVIVVNDGSKDNTEQVALSYGDRIRYFSKENGGVGTALNLAIASAKGEYISWLSHDDTYYPNKIERQIEELQKLDDKKSIIFANFDCYIQDKKEKLEIASLKEFNLVKLAYSYNMLDIFFASKLHGCTLLIPKVLFEEIGYFDAEQKTTQDYALWMKFHKVGIKYVYVSDVLVTSRQHSEQNSSALRPLHIVELNDLYRFAFDLFEEDFQKMTRWQLKYFLNTMKARELSDVYAYMLESLKMKKTPGILKFLYRITMRPVLKIIYGREKVRQKYDKQFL